MSNCDSVWRPDDSVRRDSNLAALVRFAEVPDYRSLEQKAAADPDWFWSTLLSFFDIRFSRPYQMIRDVSKGNPWADWCVGGETNLLLSGLDRHAAGPLAEKAALVWEGEDGSNVEWSYTHLAETTARICDGLRSLGLRHGDVVGLFMPMIPETVAAFLAIVKAGGIVLPLFSGYGAEAIASRLRDANTTFVFTADGYFRRSSRIAMKSVLDEAIAEIPSLRRVIVVKRLSNTIAMTVGRDVWWDDLLASGNKDAPTSIVAANAPAMIVYTSGTTGRPKGTVHTHCGFLVKTAQDYQLYFDLKSTDRLIWMSDMGWFIGPIQIVATTTVGATLVMAEGVPDFPAPCRLWELVEKHKVTFLGITPTIARLMKKAGDAETAKYDFSSLRLAASTGEPWDEESWQWLFRGVLKGSRPLLNYAGGTEVGGILATNILLPIKPTSFNCTVIGTGADVLDDEGRSAKAGMVGELVMREPAIGLTKGLWRDDGRYIETYWSRYLDIWVHGDWSSRTEDGFWYIHGRSDDTIKIAGRRTGPAEIEEHLLSTGLVAEAAAVAVEDAIKGSTVLCAVVPLPGRLQDKALAVELADAVAKGLGTAFRPTAVVFVSELPKTRNMKIVRRVVRAAISDGDVGDISALYNPSAIEDLKAAEITRV